MQRTKLLIYINLREALDNLVFCYLYEKEVNIISLLNKSGINFFQPKYVNNQKIVLFGKRLILMKHGIKS